jgi:hypothetical protein
MPGAVLILEGLPPIFTNEDLKMLCQPYGNVLFAKVLRSAEAHEEQLGFVRMETLEQAEQLVDHLHGRQVGTQTIRVTLLANEQS